jgi:hypothetical protein
MCTEIFFNNLDPYVGLKVDNIQNEYTLKPVHAVQENQSGPTLSERALTTNIYTNRTLQLYALWPVRFCVLVVEHNVTVHFMFSQLAG